MNLGERIRECRDAGMTVRQAAEKLGRSVSNLEKQMRIHGVKWIRAEEEILETILAMPEPRRITDIVTAARIGPRRAYEICARNRIEVTNEGGFLNRVWTEEEKRWTVDMYKDGVQVREIARTINRGEAAVYNFLDRWKHPHRAAYGDSPLGGKPMDTIKGDEKFAKAMNGRRFEDEPVRRRKHAPVKITIPYNPHRSESGGMYGNH